MKLGGLDAALGGLVVAAVLCHFLYHKVFGILGMKTGYPLYVVGSSTFGTKGGLLFPGIFMGLLQIGWYSVGPYYAARLLLEGFGMEAASIKAVFDPNHVGFSPLFVLMAIAWGYIFALFGAFGIQYVAKISSYLPWVAVAGVALVRVLAAYHYEVLDHHCPWCLFLPEHGGAGFLLYGSLLVVALEGPVAWLTACLAHRYPDTADAAGERAVSACRRVLTATAVFALGAGLPALLWRLRHGVWMG